MNYSTAVMLINEHIRPIKVTYEKQAQGGPKVATYLFKTLDETIKAGDYVVIPTDTRHLMTVAQVEEVDCDVDFESTLEIKWVISRVQTEEAAHILVEEAKWIETLKASEKRKKREEIKKNMIDYYNGDLEKTGIANMTHAGVLEHKPE